ncbi:hypothetical protein [Scytonema millei]|uniref:ParB/Sulfiredoxin domain-containing protein n=1 Tax=Scytonema millei VB511283 TaxID=1245923 RepID=A0A9X5E212_9CYAN|nr:hypothetical protein [Scytonema millei]NHC33801.1 hypothetical protein [Scytonema millei VB511283]
MITEELTKPNDSEVQSGTRTLSGTRSSQSRRRKAPTQEQLTSEVKSAIIQEAETPIELDINLIKVNGGTQVRKQINASRVDLLAEIVGSGDISKRFNDDPIVFYDGANYWLADGFHRLAAYQKVGRKIIHVISRQGTQRDAQLYSCTVANREHEGLPLTKEDMKQAAIMLLQDKEWNEWSSRKIAEVVGLHHETVEALRKKLTGDSASEKTKTRTYTNKHGKKGSMDTSKIGGKGGKKQSKPEIQPKESVELPELDTPPVKISEKKPLSHVIGNAPIEDNNLVAKLEEENSRLKDEIRLFSQYKSLNLYKDCPKLLKRVQERYFTDKEIREYQLSEYLSYMEREIIRFETLREKTNTMLDWFLSETMKEKGFTTFKQAEEYVCRAIKNQEEHESTQAG